MNQAVVTPSEKSNPARRASAQASPAQSVRPKVKLKPDLLLLKDPASARTEAVRALRTHLVAQHIHRGRRALAVLSPNAATGCSFVAINLALALAQIGMKVLLIDGDMRGDGLSAYCTVGGGGGLRPCLSESEGEFMVHIADDVAPNLSIMPSGGTSAMAQELIGGPRFQDLMDFCIREYDLTIVDTPPANQYSDARRISAVTGYGLIVVGQDQTFVKDIKILASQISGDGGEIVGSVLNGAW